MRSIRIIFPAVILIFVMSCQQHEKWLRTLPEIENAFQEGNLTLVTHSSDYLLVNGVADSLRDAKLRYMIDMSDRIRADFTLTEHEIEISLRKEFGEYSQNEKTLWEKNNWLEFRIIDGEKHYFKRAVPNLKLILESKLSKQQDVPEPIADKFSLFCLEHSGKVIEADKSDGKPVVPVKMNVSYILTVNKDAVPDGEIVRCWMPWPREIHKRQRDVTLLKTIPDSHFIAPDSVEQRSIYLEQKASKGKPVVFELQFEYLSMAQYFDLRKMTVLPYDTTSVIFKKYTAEQYPQILFSNKIKHLSDSIVKGVLSPVEKVRILYYWINDHIIWTGALEYSIMPDIPGYVLANRRGDCGMQTLLFMTMARNLGIPVKWQSGWMMHPGEVNLHDWCEVFYGGVGWVPLDMSFNLQKSGNLREREFYISGIDAYRLIINDAIAGRLVPYKKFFRSEPYDFQRGEVEWSGGNLYFNKWDYKMEVVYGAP